ncbi:hypothetical protein LINPERPRIM_LOCUS26843 [Linum perenne]
MILLSPVTSSPSFGDCLSQPTTSPTVISTATWSPGRFGPNTAAMMSTEARLMKKETFTSSRG